MRLLMNCSQGVRPEDHQQLVYENTPRILENIGPFTIGNLHYLQISHPSQERFCTNSIRILAGSTAIPDLTDIALTQPPPPLCQPGPRRYRIADPPPVTEFYYTVDGDTVARTHTTTLDWAEPGRYELCVGAENLCSGPVERCYPVTVRDPAPVDTTVYRCPGDCYTLGDGREVCDPGTYLATERRDGCPVEVTTTLRGLRPDTTRLLARLCSGDTLSYLNRRYATAGQYRLALTNAAGCDSTVFLTVEVTACPLRSTVTGTDVSCYGAADARLSFTVASGEPPFRYRYRRLGGGPGGSGTTAGRDLPTVINGLPTGTYLVEITDNFGSAGYLNVTLRQPDPLRLELTPTPYAGGYAIDCHGAATGRLAARATGGVAPYRYRWGEGEPTPTAARGGLVAGPYAVRVTDANGCQTGGEAELRQPDPLSLDFLPFDEDCATAGSASIEALAPAGGVAPYVTELLGPDGAPVADYHNLGAGRYQLLLTDANACRHRDTVVLRRPAVPSVSLRAEPAGYLELGEAVELTATTGGSTRWAWELPDPPDCADCPHQRLRPTATFVARVRATSVDGCTAEDSLRIRVIPRHDVYVPNAFSPNGDGVNDVLLPNLGPSAVRLLEWRIYDRWGGLLFAHNDLPAPLSPASGWDGRVASTAGAPAGAGVYVWTARVRFLDGRETTLRGDVLLVR